MTDFEKKRLFWARLAALAAVGVLLVLLVLGAFIFWEVRQLNSYSQQAEDILSGLDKISSELETVDWANVSDAMDNVAAQLSQADISEIVGRLDTVSEQLASIRWDDMAENVDALTESAQQSLDKAQAGLDEAMKAAETLDIEGLNTAIADLQTIVEPLARLMGKN